MTQSTAVLDTHYVFERTDAPTSVISLSIVGKTSDSAWAPVISPSEAVTAGRISALSVFLTVVFVLQLLIVGAVSTATVAFQNGAIPLGIAMLGPSIGGVVGMAALAYKLGKKSPVK